jgi:hypothetical protein
MGGVGCASFRARFGSDRALTEFAQPIDEVIDEQKQIRGLFSALR